MKIHNAMVVVVLWLSSTAQAFESPGFDTGAPEFSGHMQTCFSRAMVGMDSVINARLGVLPEQVVALTASTTSATPSFDEPVLAVMLAAYLWQGSPHSYAIHVFYECAASAPVMADQSDFSP
jgi:hypothetical protein